MFRFKNISTASLFAICVWLGTPSLAHAQDQGSHTVNIAIAPITVMSVSGDPLPLHIVKDATSDQTTTSDETTFYNLTTNIANVVIQAELDFPMPDGTELWLTADSRLGNSHGEMLLEGGSNTSIISGIGRGLENGRVLRYRFIATNAVDTVPLQSRSITLTLTDQENGRQQRLSQTVTFSAETTFSSTEN